MKKRWGKLLMDNRQATQNKIN